VGETNHSPSSSAEVKNAWGYTSALPYVFMAWYLVDQRERFTFTLTFCLTFFTLQVRKYVNDKFGTASLQPASLYLRVRAYSHF